MNNRRVCNNKPNVNYYDTDKHRPAPDTCGVYVYFIFTNFCDIYMILFVSYTLRYEMDFDRF